jgi:hypothetical protein
LTKGRRPMLLVIGGSLLQRPRRTRRLRAAVSIAVISLDGAGAAQTAPEGSPEAFFFRANC